MHEDSDRRAAGLVVSRGEGQRAIGADRRTRLEEIRVVVAHHERNRLVRRLLGSSRDVIGEAGDRRRRIFIHGQGLLGEVSGGAIKRAVDHRCDGVAPITRDPNGAPHAVRVLGAPTHTGVVGVVELASESTSHQNLAVGRHGDRGPGTVAVPGGPSRTTVIRGVDLAVHHRRCQLGAVSGRGNRRPQAVHRPEGRDCPVGSVVGGGVGVDQAVVFGGRELVTIGRGRDGLPVTRRA